MIKLRILEAISVNGTKYVLLFSLKKKINEQELQIRKVKAIILKAAAQRRIIFYGSDWPHYRESAKLLAKYF